jgi:hypothetical protein
MIDIATSSKYIPEVVLDYVKILKEHPELVVSRDNEYIALTELNK